MKTHPLIEKAFIYPSRPKPEVSREYEFNQIKGYWINRKDKSICIMNDNFSKPRTKKADIETGEDQKGE